MSNLHTIRKVKKITQQELALYMGVTQATILMWEDGRCPIDSHILVRLAEYFNCTVDYLLGRTDSPKLVIKKAPPNDEGITEYVMDKDAAELTLEEIKLLRKFVEDRGILN